MGAAKARSAPIPVFDAADRAVMGESKAGAPGADVGPVRLAGASDGEVRSYMTREEGGSAIRLSEAIAAYKGAETAPDRQPGVVRTVGKRIFYCIEGVWVDRNYRPTMKMVRLAYASDEYFAFADKHPELRSALALGPKVKLCLDDGTAVVVE